MVQLDLLAATTAGAAGLLGTALVLGLRHGVDWDHIAAITDITSTTAAADVATGAHLSQHAAVGTGAHRHGHGGPDELAAHDRGPGTAVAAPAIALQTRHRISDEQRHAVVLGTLYALGHASVVAALGLVALAFGALLPEWLDPIMGRVVGFTLVFLGIWVWISLYQYAFLGVPFRMRSRWMLVFDSVRYAWRRLQARLHGHEHVAPLEMSSYGPRTAFGVGVIHGIGAETGTQVLIIAAVGGASGVGLGVPMMVAFIVGLLVSNTIIVFVSATGFAASQVRDRLYIGLGVVAGTMSILLGLVFITGSEAILPALDGLFGPPPQP